MIRNCVSRILEHRNRLAVSAFAVLITLGSAGIAAGHVNLDAPLGGESVEVGDTLLIEWSVFIEHDTQDFDLWYSTEGSDGPWIDIAQDIPAPCVEAGCAYDFSWEIPVGVAGESLWIRVRQDNSGGDYFAVTASPLTVAPVASEFFFTRGDADGNGTISIADPVRVLAELFPAGVPAPGCEASFDGNGDQTVDLSDAVFLLSYLFDGGAPPPSPFPACGGSTEAALACETSGCP